MQEEVCSEFGSTTLTSAQAAPAVMTPFAIGLESGRCPSRPLSSPPKPRTCPGFWNSSTATAAQGAAGCAKSPLVGGNPNTVLFMPFEAVTVGGEATLIAFQPVRLRTRFRVHQDRVLLRCVKQNQCQTCKRMLKRTTNKYLLLRLFQVQVQ